MKRALLVFTFSAFAALNVFAAEHPSAEPDTIFQKLSVWIGGGYKKSVEPIKKVEVFRDSANWVAGSSQEN